MRNVLTLATTALLLAGCGAYRIGPGEPPSPAPNPRLVTQISTEDDGRAVAVHTGTVLNVALIASNGWGNWQHPQTSDPLVLEPTVNPAAAAIRGATLAAYRALKLGTSRLTSFSTPLCPPGQACATIAKTWAVTVTVIP